MRHLNKLASVFCGAALGLMSLTGCDGGDLYNIGAPDWLSDAIADANANKGGDDEELEGMQEDVYTIGATDYSTGWWAQFSKYYQIKEGEKWNAVFTLNINPSASNTYKNFALIICNDEDRGAANYREYGAIRYDNQPSGNSEWGDYIDRGSVVSTLTFDTDTDSGIEKLGGRVVLTIDRSDPSKFIVKMTNGTVTKTYTQNSPLVNINADASNTTIRAFLVPEGSFINFLQSNIEPIGGFTSAEDKQPISMILKGVPKKVLQGTDLMTLAANITAEVQFEQEVSKTVTAADLTFESVPDVNSLGTKTLVAVYNKTYKGENCATPVIATAEFQVVDKMYTTCGELDNSTPFFGARTDLVKVGPHETYITTFTNYTNGAANWNNYIAVLSKGDLGLGADGEYAVLRADNFGWGNGYGTCTPACDHSDWATWLSAMDGGRVTLYVTNNGDGTADVKAVTEGSDGNTYTQTYTGISAVDPNDFYFSITMEGAHIEFDQVVGPEDNITEWWASHSDMYQVPVGQTVTTRFRNYTNGAANWNNFLVVLTREDLSEYAVVRADNWGWGASYDGIATNSGGQTDWGTWLSAMDEALVTVSVTNQGGSVDVNCIMLGNDGNTYEQWYKGISPTDGDNVYFNFTVDGSHLVFE